MSAVASTSASPSTTANDGFNRVEVSLEPYAGEHDMAHIIDLIEKELSEPYIVYTYRYFVNQWPSLCFLARAPSPTRQPVGVIVCKLDRHLKGSRLVRGYIAMISVKTSWRRNGLAKKLVNRALAQMIHNGAQEVVLETEADNIPALSLYQGLGFVKEKRLHRFYLNGKDSFRLVLPIPPQLWQPTPPHVDAPPPIALVQPPYPFNTASTQRPHPQAKHDSEPSSNSHII